MPQNVNFIDRLRIERLVWALDQQLYDLPRRSRIAHRREVRANLRAAAAEVGTSQALRRVGGSRALAKQFLTAEFGDGPRHSWTAATAFAVLVPLALTFFLGEAANAYQNAITTADPQVTGTFTWSGVSYVQSAVRFDARQGAVTQIGGAFTPLVYILLPIGTIVCGRLWRALPWLRTRRTAE